MVDILKKQTRGVGGYLILALLLIVILGYLPGLIKRGQTVSENTFTEDLKKGNIQQIEISQNREVPTGSLLYNR